MTGPRDSFAAIVLAAGSARRFGGGKLLTPFEGAPLLHHALASARAAPVDEVIVVTGADAERVGACARAFDPTLRIVHAPDHAEGLSASLRAGLAAASQPCAGVIVFLGDMPRTPPAVLPPLAQAIADGAPAAAPVYGGRRGNPVALAARLFDEVRALKGDVGARPILRALGSDVAEIPSPDDGVLFDVDAPEDLAGFRP